MTDHPTATGDGDPGQPTTSPLHPRDKHDDMTGGVEPAEERPDDEDEATEDQDGAPPGRGRPRPAED